MMTLPRQRTQGMVLIFTLWTLGFLVILALQLGIQIRQKIRFVAHVQERSQMRSATGSAVRKAILLLKESSPRNPYFLFARKAFRHNNREQFQNIVFDSVAADVRYFCEDEPQNLCFGLADEEGKINLNFADAATLTRLISEVLSWPLEPSQKLARAIVDWRQWGSSELDGFFSDNYYENLEYPYPIKHALFEHVYELLLVEGFQEEVLEALRPFVTIYGAGKVNINTASAVVLRALNIPQKFLDALLKARRGKDGQEATADDRIFDNIYHLPQILQEYEKFSVEDLALLDAVPRMYAVDTRSDFYAISAVAHIPSPAVLKSAGKVALAPELSDYEAACVYQVSADKIVFWQER